MAKRKLGYEEPLIRKVDQPKYVKNKPAEVTTKPLGAKYELTDNTRLYRGEKLYQIRALRDFDNVAAGDLGGYVAGEHNLSHAGLCWIAQRGISCGNGLVTGNAWVMDDAVVKEDATLLDNAYIFNHVVLRAQCCVKGTVQLFKRVVLGGRKVLRGDLKFDNNVELSAYLTAELEKRKGGR